MEKLLEFLVKSIVNKPEEVEITESSDEIGKVMIIKLAEEDKAFVIGKSGRNIKAIRDICSIISKKNGEKVFIKIEED